MKRKMSVPSRIQMRPLSDRCLSKIRICNITSTLQRWVASAIPNPELGMEESWKRKEAKVDAKYG